MSVRSEHGPTTSFKVPSSEAGLAYARVLRPRLRGDASFEIAQTRPTVPATNSAVFITCGLLGTPFSTNSV